MNNSRRGGLLLGKLPVHSHQFFINLLQGFSFFFENSCLEYSARLAVKPVSAQSIIRLISMDVAEICNK